MELKGKKINFLGDSITEGYGASSKENRYTDIIERESGAICRNYGISGTRIARQHIENNGVPENSDFCSRVHTMDPDADIVCVFGGTNDFGHGDAGIGDFSDRTPDTFCGALNMLYSSLIERFPQARIVILTPLHRTGENEPSGMAGSEPKTATLKEYVDLIKKAAEYYSLPVLDLFSVSGMQPQVPVIKEKYVPDGLHPNDAGHARLAQIITAFLSGL